MSVFSHFVVHCFSTKSVAAARSPIAPLSAARRLTTLTRTFPLQTPSSSCTEKQHQLRNGVLWSAPITGDRGGSCSPQTRAIQAFSASTVAMSLPTPTVEATWLLNNLENVKVLDASWYMPAENRSPFSEFQAGRIPESLFFDVNAISDPTTKLPHMLPTEAAFSAAASALGLSNSDTIVIYDGKGIFSAARAWWMFRVFGHDSVAVLEGGLPHWKSLGLPLELAPDANAQARHEAAVAAVKAAYEQAGGQAVAGDLSFSAHLRKELVLSREQVLENIDKRNFEIVDARSAGRFLGTDPEPRPGLSSGSIPGSFNVPFPKVLDAEGGLLCPVELEAAFKEAGVDPKSANLAASCGTGVTACVLALALFRLGRQNVPVYDGSWTEWASTEGSPITKQAS